MKETIIAQSSPAGRGAVSIIRLSGRDAVSLLEGSFSSKAKPVHAVMRLGVIDAGGIKDKVMTSVFFAPDSYTGEDVAEIYCHGSPAIVGRIISHFISRGAKAAEGGEFTKRAFLNGKLTLDEAEAVCDLINAESDAQINAAYSAVSGKVAEGVAEISAVITDVLAGIEAAIDYPEEDLELETADAAGIRLTAAERRLDALVRSYGSGSLIRSGVRVAIVGAPNAGKSSLLNALLGYDRAIVHEKPGTTRDTIEESYTHRGMLFTLVDTAGLRTAVDEAEIEGVRRSNEEAKRAHLVLWLGDDSGFCGRPRGDKVVKVLNKSDLNPAKTDADIEISALRGCGIDALKDLICDKTLTEVTGKEMLTNARHFDAASNALLQLRSALADLTAPPDCFAVYLKNALVYLGQITGATADEDVINRIFAKFCVGK